MPAGIIGFVCVSRKWVEMFVFARSKIFINTFATMITDKRISDSTYYSSANIMSEHVINIVNKHHTVGLVALKLTNITLYPLV